MDVGARRTVFAGVALRSVSGELSVTWKEQRWAFIPIAS
jgi:hypothetical protein